ncbi:MAG: tRNA (N6-isopentenyl adenosine(37)-C2)-methylthiotransferase MiaB, partial [Humidesulfovibrio sp.]|nr:tRNA (N6-isopentenyl adenosine(37)-C2)-methylthiotransferase MiaB [Humidesulfovibrio sp.]
GEDFAQTLEMMELVRFESSFSFRYSDRPGVASLRLRPKVPDEVGQERLLRLQSLQNGITKETLKALEGCETDVLLEAPSRRQDEGGHFWRGRDAGGRVVNVHMSSGLAGQEPLGAALCGRMVRARILEAKNHSLLGEEVGLPW